MSTQLNKTASMDFEGNIEAPDTNCPTINLPVLSLIDPWGTLVMLREKEWETRSWYTAYRGPLLIHVSAAMDAYALETVKTKPYVEALKQHGIVIPTYPQNMSEPVHERNRIIRGLFPLGHIIGIVNLSEVRNMGTHKLEPWIDTLSDKEKAFGFYSVKRFGWKMDSATRLVKPLAVKGNRLLWKFDLPIDALPEGYRYLSSEKGI